MTWCNAKINNTSTNETHGRTRNIWNLLGRRCSGVTTSTAIQHASSVLSSYEQSNALSKMTWCRGINSSNMMKTLYSYPRWQQYNTCLAAPTVTEKGHRKIEPKAKHFSHCKNYRSSRPNQTNNSKRLPRILWTHIKSSEKNQIFLIDNLGH